MPQPKLNLFRIAAPDRTGLQSAMTDNLDTAERDKFAALATEWWDDAGAARTLHDINPCRLDSAPSGG